MIRAEYFQELENGQIHIKKELFNQFSEPAVCWRLLEEFGFNLDQAEDIFKNLNEQSGSQFFSKSHRLVIDRDTFVIQPLSDLVNNEVTLITGEGKFQLDNQEMECKISNSPYSTNPAEAWLNYSKLVLPLTWRKWEKGDRFIPLGMNGFKKVSDFLIDEKVTIPEKEKVTVIVSDGEIVWVVGMRIDERVKLDDVKSKSFLLKCV
jgi:tRNA(Ile)-lysidine synthase